MAALVCGRWDTPVGHADGSVSPEGAEYRQDFEIPGVDRVVDYWEPVRDDAHPHYNQIVLSGNGSGRKAAHGGKSFLAMKTLGGNTAFQTTRTLIEIDPSRSYQLSGWARTKSLKKNNVYCSLRWLDKLGILLTEDRSDTVTAVDDWVELTVRSDAPLPSARYVQIRLNMDGGDIDGEAHFDDVVLTSQMKIVAEAVGRPTHVFTTKEKKTFRFLLPSASGQHSFRFVVRDLLGREALPPSVAIAADPRSGATQTFDIDAVGYYEIEIEATGVVGDAKYSARRVVPFAVVDEDYFAPGVRREIGAVINPFESDTSCVVDYLKTLGVEKTKIVLWGNGVRPKGSMPDIHEVQQLLKTLWVERMEMMGVIGKPSPSYAGRGRVPSVTGGVVAFFSQDREKWEDALKDMVKRSREYFRFWQIGVDGEREPESHPDSEHVVMKVEKVIKEIKAFSVVGMPVSLGTARDKFATPQFFAVDLSRATLADIEASPRLAGKNIHFVLPISSRGSGERHAAMTAQMTDLIEKYLSLRKAGVDQVYIPLKSNSFDGILDNDGLPTPSLLCARTLNKLLSGTQYVDQHLFSGSVKDAIFTRGRERVVALWNESGEVEKDVYLGEGARIVEPTGREFPAPLGRPLKIGRLPIFIVNVDSDLLDTLLALKFENNVLPLSGGVLSRNLSFVNKFQSNIQNVKIDIRKVPRGWFVKPLSISENEVKPGESMTAEIEFRIPPTEIAREADLVISLSFKTSQSYQTQVVRTMRLAPNLDVDASFPQKTLSEDRLLKLAVSNASERIVNAKALVTIPGSRTLEISLPSLAPGQVFPIDLPIDRYKEVKGKEAKVRIFETNGNLFVNKNFRIP